jgi:hypothetical protein
MVVPLGACTIPTVQGTDGHPVGPIRIPGDVKLSPIGCRAGWRATKAARTGPAFPTYSPVALAMISFATLAGTSE